MHYAQPIHGNFIKYIFRLDFQRMDWNGDGADGALLCAVRYLLHRHRRQFRMCQIAIYSHILYFRGTLRATVYSMMLTHANTIDSKLPQDWSAVI